MVDGSTERYENSAVRQLKRIFEGVLFTKVAEWTMKFVAEEADKVVKDLHVTHV